MTVVNAEKLARECLKHLRENTSKDTPIFLVDNGSNPPIKNIGEDYCIRFHQNIGGNAVFHEVMPHMDAFDIDIIAFLHCDMMVREPQWDVRIKSVFGNPRIGLCGFVASNEIDEKGGRGGGTVLNYAGHFYEGFGQASKAEDHGRRSNTVEPAAVLDHCSMIFRKIALHGVPPQRGNYAPGHFYDRICCAQLIALGWWVAYVGIACDHFSGGVAGGILEQLALYERWLQQEGIPYEKNNIDQAIYIESERRFLTQFRDQYQLIPYKIDENFDVWHAKLTNRGWEYERFYGPAVSPFQSVYGPGDGTSSYEHSVLWDGNTGTTG